MTPRHPARPRPRLSFGRGCAAAWALLAGLLAGGVASAQTSVERGLEVSAQRWVDQLARSAAQNSASGSAGPLRMEVSVGSLDNRLQLAPCDQVEPYLPANTRLWGRSRIGLRCLQGAVRWNVYLPITVKAFGPAWVLRDAVPAGTVLQPEHALQAEVDWADESAPVLALPEQWQGQLAARPLSAGQTLRQGLLRPPQAFGPGAPLRVVAEGRGFSVTTGGQALAAGSVGQLVRVRMDNGRVLSAVVVDERTVRVAL